MSSPLAVGDKSPDFKLTGVVAGRDKHYSLGSYLGKQNVLLVFYAFDWTDT